jgi:transposase
MKRFIEGVDRGQSSMFPERLDDWIGEDNPVRVIDVFVDELDLLGLGFDRVEPRETGRPSYHPSVLLKLYVYGYLNRVQSSRRLEREAGRNVEVMWLTERLEPDHKTIADFRKDSGPAIRRVCREFVVLCRRLDLFADAFVAIDGSKFKAVNNRDRNFTAAKMKRRMAQIEESVERYLQQLDSADRQEPSLARTTKTARLKDKITKLKEEMQRLEKLEVRRLEAPDQQISLTDPDARSMATSGRGSGMVGYNVQASVDAKHHLIIAHEVTETKAVLEIDELDAVADRGYYKGEEILACKQAGITVTLPKPQTSQGPFRKTRFSLHSRRGCLPLPRWRASDLPLHDARKGPRLAPLLDQCLCELRPQGALHHGKGAPHHPLGARTCSRGRPVPARRASRDDAPAPRDRRASLRDHQDLDGRDPLPDEDA